MTQAPPAPGHAPVPLAQAMSNRQRWAVLLSLVVALFVAALDQTVVSTATPKILADLGGFNLISWLFTSYMLTSTVVMPVVGKMGDIYGRKWILFGGVIAFMVSSAACGAAPSMEALVILRGVQGIGGGIIMASVFATLGDLFTPIERGKYMGLFTGTFSLASLVGPVLGGLLTDNGGWRWIFYLNIPVALIALPAIAINLPARKRIRRVQLDLVGAALLSAAAVLFLMALEWAGDEYAWGSPQVIGLIFASAVLVLLFVNQERRHPEPILPLSLFRNRVFVTANLILFTFGVGVFGCFQYLGLFIQTALDKSATTSGVITMPQSLGVVVSSIIGGQVIARVGRYRYQTVLGAILIAIAMALLSTIDLGINPWALRGYLLVLGLGFGMVLPTMSLVVQNAVPFQHIGTATSSSQFFRQIGAVLGAAVFAVILARSYEADFADRLAPEDAQALGPAVVAQLNDPTLRLNPRAVAAIERQAAATPEGSAVVGRAFSAQKSSVAAATRTIFMAALIASLACVAIAVMLKEIPMRRPGTAPVGGPAAAPGGSPRGGERQPVAAMPVTQPGVPPTPVEGDPAGGGAGG